TFPANPTSFSVPAEKVIQVHGCFWHQHNSTSCEITRKPKSNIHYWTPKLARNIARDLEHLKSLSRLGWKVLTIWECELGNESALTKRLVRFLRERHFLGRLIPF